jgi:hypothetical protein
MARLVTVAILLCASAAHAQRHQLWVNRGLTGRGVDVGEQQMILRQDLSACHGSAFEGSRGVQDEAKRKAVGVAMFNRCMDDKGWEPRDPAPRKSPAKAPKEAAA